MVTPAAALFELNVVALAGMARHSLAELLAEIAAGAGIDPAVGSAAPRLTTLIESVSLAESTAAARFGAAVALAATPCHTPFAAQVAPLAFAVRAVIALHLAP